jgi:hypothetical protein
MYIPDATLVLWFILQVAPALASHTGTAEAGAAVCATPARCVSHQEIPSSGSLTPAENHINSGGYQQKVLGSLPNAMQQSDTRLFSATDTAAVNSHIAATPLNGTLLCCRTLSTDDLGRTSAQPGCGLYSFVQRSAESAVLMLLLMYLGISSSRTQLIHLLLVGGILSVQAFTAMVKVQPAGITRL